ncbi:MAG TPA: hypoxanthine-guanine phosphoribosyltransferase [Methylophilaceae bacterium]|jgi:hypoxanthine phosphoribosyltransferase
MAGDAKGMMQQDPRQILNDADLIFSAQQVTAAISQVAAEVTQALSNTTPLVLSVMGGAVVFSGQLLPLLNFPLEFDFVQASRYHDQNQATDLEWRVLPTRKVQGKTVLVLDDILDEGITLAAVRDKCLELGAVRVLVAVLSEKDTGRPKPIKADFTGLMLPDRYVFGCGMDVHGWWRNLPAIYALKDQH